MGKQLCVVIVPSNRQSKITLHFATEVTSPLSSMHPVRKQPSGLGTRGSKGGRAACHKCTRSDGSHRYGVKDQLPAKGSATVHGAASAAGLESARMDNNFSSFGGEGSQSQPFFGSDQWAYRFATSGANFEDQNSQPLDTSEAEVEEVPKPPAKKGKEKKVSRRSTNFTKEDDAVICSAFLNISKDPITGTNQNQGSYYRRMHEYFNVHKPEDSNRSQLAIQGRWGVIQRAVNKFCGYKAVVDRGNESGKNEQDRIEDAIKLYEKKEPFGFLHCWKILKDQQKWNERVLEHSTAGTSKGKDSCEGNPTPEEGHTPLGNNVDERPEGRDSAKRRAKRDAESSSSVVVEVLQKIHDSRDKIMVKEDEQMREILHRKDEKINIKREILKVHMNESMHKKQAREESMQLRKHEAELLAKQVEAQLLTAEAGIMAVDLDKVAPHLKDYYIGMQKQIMERRGFLPSNGSSS